MNLEEVRIDPALWRKSTRSVSSGDCVEIAVTDQVVGMRDSRRREGGELRLTRAQWQDFMDAVVDGEFD